MTEVVLVASKSVVSVDHKTNELVVSNRRVEVIINTNPLEKKDKSTILGLKVDFVELTEQHIAAKKAYITRPKMGGIILDVIGGSPQYEGFDYTVRSDHVSWSSLGLEEILAVGDILRLAYIEVEG